MSELRQFLIGGGLLDEGETLSQGLDRLDQLYTEVLQDYNQPEPSATSTAMEGERFIFKLFIIITCLHVAYFYSKFAIHR